MNLLSVVLVIAVTLGICLLVDKGFTFFFRSQVQHISGLSVRVNKRYSVFGLILILVGILAVVTGVTDGPVLFWGGVIVALMGIALVVYYLSFGVFYDDDSFLFTTFGKKPATYRYSDIVHQQLYVVQGGNVVIELHMKDKSAVSLQSSMVGTYDFLDHAFGCWCRQKNRNPEDCTFHDPDNSIWFPMEEA